MKLDDSTQIISVELINVDNGEVSTLFERRGSRCHFNEVFHFQGYFIQLRLDWDDVKTGEPLLDADIWTETNGKKIFLRKGSWHHTEKKLDEETGKKVYTFRFENLVLHLATKKTIAKTFTVDTILIRLAPEAKKVLDRLSKKAAHFVRKRAIELSIEKGRDYDVRLEDVLEAEDELELRKSGGVKA
jgi:predicted DNA-binding protein